jgi:hypothetical protein
MKSRQFRGLDYDHLPIVDLDLDVSKTKRFNLLYNMLHPSAGRV